MDAMQVVLKFYEDFRNAALSEDLFTEDFHFQGIIKGFDDMEREAFVAAFNQLSALVKEHRLQEIVCEGERVFVSLNFISQPNEVNDVRFADLFICKDGRIDRLITHFDPRAFFVLPMFQEGA